MFEFNELKAVSEILKPVSIERRCNAWSELVPAARVGNVLIFEKTIVSLRKRRGKSENETIVFKNDRFLKKFVF